MQIVTHGAHEVNKRVAMVTSECHMSCFRILVFVNVKIRFLHLRYMLIMIVALLCTNSYNFEKPSFYIYLIN